MRYCYCHCPVAKLLTVPQGNHSILIFSLQCADLLLLHSHTYILVFNFSLVKHLADIFPLTLLG